MGDGTGVRASEYVGGCLSVCLSWVLMCASETTEAFFNTTLEYLDRLDYVARYSWFGAFRSDVSNVGPSGAMLDAHGKLTDLGDWYLGRAGTGVDGAAGRKAVSEVLVVVVVVVAVVMMRV